MRNPLRHLRFRKVRITFLLVFAIILHGINSVFNSPKDMVETDPGSTLLQAIDQPRISSEFSSEQRNLNSFTTSLNAINNTKTSLLKNQSRDAKPQKTNRPLQLQVKCGKQPKVLEQIQVGNLTSKSPKVLCFIMTHSGSHNTKMKAIRRTWGRRCDKLVIASNQTDDILGAVTIQSEATYVGLWEKLNITMRYIWEHYRNDTYDWIFKSDDDTYLIVENLKEYLASKHITSRIHKPMIHGRRYSSPQYKNLAKRPVYFGNPVNAEFGKRFYEKIHGDKPVIYNYGGAGYAMNWPYVEKFLEVMSGPDTVHGIPPEDQAHGVVMAYHDIWPENTRDELNRERFHQESPEFMYGMSDEYRRLWNDNHQETGGLSVGPDCCSSQSVSFHHIKPRAMVGLDQHLYACRGQD